MHVTSVENNNLPFVDTYKCPTLLEQSGRGKLGSGVQFFEKSLPTSLALRHV